MGAARLLVALVALAACSDDDPAAVDGGVDAAPDARTEGAVQVVAVVASPTPGSLAPLQVRVNGEVVPEREEWVFTYPDAAAFRAGMVGIELRAGDVVVDAETVATLVPGCEAGGLPEVVRLELCAYAHGELRLAARSYRSPTRACVDDVLCRPDCSVIDGATCPGKKCAAELSSLTPVYSRLTCVPVGAVAIGGACTWTHGGDGRYRDNCASGATCVASVCRAHCVENCGQVPCRTVLGYPRELMVCAPP